MGEPIVSRERIARTADAAAARTAASGCIEHNPFPADTAAHRCWKADYERYLLVHSSVTEDEEGGA